MSDEGDVYGLDGSGDLPSRDHLHRFEWVRYSLCVAHTPMLVRSIWYSGDAPETGVRWGSQALTRSALELCFRAAERPRDRFAKKLRTEAVPAIASVFPLSLPR